MAIGETVLVNPAFWVGVIILYVFCHIPVMGFISGVIVCFMTPIPHIAALIYFINFFTEQGRKQAWREM